MLYENNTHLPTNQIRAFEDDLGQRNNKDLEREQTWDLPLRANQIGESSGTAVNKEKS